MDTLHDLGGVEGFGPVAVDAPPFSHDWERRMWAIAKNLPAVPGSTLDWWRHIVERMPPGAYMNMPYFEKWCLAHMANMVLGGVFTADEVLAGSAPRRREPPEATGIEGARERLRLNEHFFDRPPSDPPAFAPGAMVRTRRHVAARHTRLPRYARDRLGRVIAHHGAHLLPDASAMGVERAEHLYTVAFTAPELWGEGDPRDEVTLDLWESYLGPA